MPDLLTPTEDAFTFIRQGLVLRGRADVLIEICRPQGLAVKQQNA